MGKKNNKDRVSCWTPEKREAMRQKALDSIRIAKEKGVYVEADESKSEWSDEKRAEYAAREKDISMSRSAGWTPERREEARLRMLKARENTIDEINRMKRRTKTRYLMKVDTKEVFVWTERLAERKDMVEINELPKDTKKSRD